MIVHYLCWEKSKMLMNINIFYFTEGLLSFCCGIGRKIWTEIINIAWIDRYFVCHLHKADSCYTEVFIQQRLPGCLQD
jgi:hypothetical protein